MSLATRKLGRRSFVASLIVGTSFTRLVGRVDAWQAEAPLRITTTTGMVADLVRNIGGDRVSVIALMGPGVDPHLYRPSAGDVQKLSEADLVFFSGLHLEGRMTDLLEELDEATGVPAFAVTAEIPEDRLRRPAEFAGNFDPHIWFDVTLWTEAADAVRDDLTAFDPGHAAEYAANHDAYVTQLDELDRYIREQIARLPERRRVLITAHDAFGYFGDQYGLEVRGLQGTSTASEASANGVQSLAEFIAERQIPAIFVESSVPAATIEAVREAVNDRGWDVVIGGQLYSDAMGADGTPEGTYLGMFRANVDTVVGALLGSPATPEPE